MLYIFQNRNRKSQPFDINIFKNKVYIYSCSLFATLEMMRKYGHQVIILEMARECFKHDVVLQQLETVNFFWKCPWVLYSVMRNSDVVGQTAPEKKLNSGINGKQRIYGLLSDQIFSCFDELSYKTTYPRIFQRHYKTPCKTLKLKTF